MQTISLSVRSLVEFVLRSGSIDSRFSGADRALEGTRIHRKLQKAGGENYQAEVVMKATRVVDDIAYLLEGRADGIITEESGIVIDEIKTTAAPTEQLTEDFNPLHWAQAKCYAAFYCSDNHLETITVQLTYYQIDTDEIVRHRQKFTAAGLETFLLETLRLYTPWAKLSGEWKPLRNASLQALTFPYSNYREGQYRLAGAVYRTIAAQGRLFAGAPTGIGKTVSTLFPALKAMGEGYGERIFYLTAKTITRQSAEDALERMRIAGGDNWQLKTITLTAKDKVCLLDERNCTPEACPYADGYYDRINSALYTFLQQQNRFTREDIQTYAKENKLCPFELALDLTLFCDCIICDYNYLFYPVVSLQRFFTSGGDYVFLIDEAHNLVDRARDMYSAAVKKSDFYSVKKVLGKTPRKLVNALKKVNDRFIDLRHQCEDAESRQLVQAEYPDDFVKSISKFVAAAEKWLDEHREGELHAQILQLYFDARFFIRIAELYDEHFTTLISAFGNEVQLQLLCLDAAPFLDASMALGRASVLFSATLSPTDYFIQTLGGGEDAKCITLQSPFPNENVCLLVADKISTKYADRTKTLPDVCDMIAAAVMAKEGNYLVFAPSYQYMQDVSDAFSERYPQIAVCRQESGMNESAREDFLAQFDTESGNTLVGFCVLGGIFSEGIDLKGERLIGSIIVGVGLPQIGPEQDALRDYYAATQGLGFEYAYQFPGMNKVLQAAGRVIRTETDKGVILLIDSRYSTSRYRSLFPPHWAGAKSVNNAAQVVNELKNFWGSF